MSKTNNKTNKIATQEYTMLHKMIIAKHLIAKFALFSL